MISYMGSKFGEDIAYPTIGGTIGAAPSSQTAPTVETVFAAPGGGPVLKFPGVPNITPPAPPSTPAPPPVTGTVAKPSCGGTCSNPNANPLPSSPGSATTPAAPSVGLLRLADGTDAASAKPWYEGVPWYVWVALALATYSTLRK